MGIFHELLIVVGVCLMLIIGWAASITVREGLRRDSSISMTNAAARPKHTCQGGMCTLNP